MAELAVLSLAANIFQVIEFACETFSTLKRIRKDGQPDASLAEQAAHLGELSQHLSKSLSSAPLTQDDSTLRYLARRCEHVTKSLCIEMEKVSRSHAGKIGVFTKSVWRKSKIKRLEQVMGRIRDGMRMQILYNVRFQQQAANAEQHEGFRTLDDQLQTFILELANRHKNTADIVTKECQTTRETVINHFTAELYDQRTTERDQKAHERLLSSLRVDSMHARKNDVAGSHRKTFGWIFDGENAEKRDVSKNDLDEDDLDADNTRNEKHGNYRIKDFQRPWDSFTEFLKGQEKIYWVNGKAGSGKSTLMKFVINDPRTQRALKVWSPGEEALIISYFIWNAGTPMQRSIKGLLSALLYQILDEQPDIATTMLHNNPGLTKKFSPTDWSIPDLEECLHQSIRSSARKVMIFVDGLDEIERTDPAADDGVAELIRCVEELADLESTKVCVSSRPEAEFMNAFQSLTPQLRLQDLTRRDIHVVVHDFLRRHNLLEVDLDDRANSENLVWTITYRAEGVLLWVHLALKDLERGIARNDPRKALLTRLDRLPSGLYALYKSMWRRLGEDDSIYGSEAAFYLNCVLDTRNGDVPSVFFHPNPISVPVLSFAELFHHMCDSPPEFTLHSTADLIKMCKRTKKRVQDCCVGLIEFLETRPSTLLSPLLLPLPSGGFSRANQPVKSLICTVAQFSHRSAVQFLKETDEGRSILAFDKSCLSRRQFIWMIAGLSVMANGVFPFIGFLGVHTLTKIVSESSNRCERHDKYAVQCVPRETLHCEQAFESMMRTIRTHSARSTADLPAWIGGWKGLSLKLIDQYVEAAFASGLTCLVERLFTRLSSSHEVTKEFKSYLLYKVTRCTHSMRWGCTTVQEVEQLSLRLLEEGADPNLALTGCCSMRGIAHFSQSPFQSFLESISIHALRGSLEGHASYFRNVLRSFLSHGADLEVNACFRAKLSELFVYWKEKTQASLQRLRAKLSKIGVDIDVELPPSQPHDFPRIILLQRYHVCFASHIPSADGARQEELFTTLQDSSGQQAEEIIREMIEGMERCEKPYDHLSKLNFPLYRDIGNQVLSVHVDVPVPYVGYEKLFEIADDGELEG